VRHAKQHDAAGKRDRVRSDLCGDPVIQFCQHALMQLWPGQHALLRLEFAQ